MVIVQNYDIFCQFRSKLAITNTIAIKRKEKYDAVEVYFTTTCVCVVTE